MYSATEKPTGRSVRDRLKENIPSWAPASSKSIADTAIEHLNNAYANFFAKRARYPKFKSKHSAKQSFEIYRKNDSSIRIHNNKWLLAKMKIKMSEELRFSGEIKRLTCSKCNEKYFISIIFDDSLPPAADNGKSIGLDWGIRNSKGVGNYFTGDQGQHFNLPDLSRYEMDLKFRQRRLSKCKKGSNRAKKAKAKLSRLYERISSIKSDAQNKLVHELISLYSHIAMEKLSMQGLVKKSKGQRAKRKAILRYSNYQIRIAIKCKVFEFREVDTHFPSSQICSCCGTKHSEMRDDKIRQLVCSCGLTIDRDLNAAKNILKNSVALKK